MLPGYMAVFLAVLVLWDIFSTFSRCSVRVFPRVDVFWCTCGGRWAPHPSIPSSQSSLQSNIFKGQYKLYMEIFSSAVYLILFCYDTVVLPLGNKCFIYCMVFLMTLSAIFFLCFSLFSNCLRGAKEPSESQLPSWTLKSLTYSFLWQYQIQIYTAYGKFSLWHFAFMKDLS